MGQLTDRLRGREVTVPVERAVVGELAACVVPVATTMERAIDGDLVPPAASSGRFGEHVAKGNIASMCAPPEAASATEPAWDDCTTGPRLQHRFHAEGRP